MAQDTRIWFITGCSTGFGYEIAKLVLSQGKRVVMTARKPSLSPAWPSSIRKPRPPGIHVTIVEPGPFRTDWAGRSIIESKKVIDDYAPTAGKRRESTVASSGNQIGDPVRGAAAVVKAVESPEPPLRLLHGAPALKLAYGRLDALRANFDAWKEATLSADFPQSTKKD